ncbi:hypothetical protein J4443_02970 [Candidatus Woesearchaeota archaeon]|nr:hypothetical protein [Candidatus Woesearchaeota archaeon]
MSSKKRKKQLEKRIEGLKEQIAKHKGFIGTMGGRLDTTQDYWRKEIERFENKKKLSEEKLRKLKEK